MARTRGRWAQEQQEEDPIIDLYIAVVERAHKDLRLPARHAGSTGSYPTRQEKESAAEFLESLYAAATRRQME